VKTKNTFYQTASTVVLILGWVTAWILYYGKDSAYKAAEKVKAECAYERKELSTIKSALSRHNINFTFYDWNNQLEVILYEIDRLEFAKKVIIVK